MDKLRLAMEGHGLAAKGGHIVVGVSGGPDSLCLLHGLSRLAPEWGMSLSAIHVNHCIRGEAADRDQAATEAFCRSLKIPCYTVKKDVPALAVAEGLSVEEAGRQTRYEAFEERRWQAEQEGMAPIYIAIAQNKDDQAETVLMRILRGTGTDGLAGMEVVRDGYIIRPLLDVSREEIEDYCRSEGIVPCRDRTNEETLYTRNRIRLKLLPYLRENYNANITETLVRLAAIAAEDKDCLYEAIKDVERVEIPEGRTVSRQTLTALHPALRKRVVMEVFKDLGLRQDITALHLEQADRLITEGRTSASLNLPEGYRLQVGYENMKFLAPAPNPAPGPAPPKAPGQNPLVQNIISKEDYDALAPGPGEALKTQAFFDMEALQEQGGLPLICRTRRPGDFIRPKGMSGSKKLQDLLVDRKIPREERDRLPLICRGSEVLWIPGCCISGTAAPGPETKNILFLEFLSDMW